MTTQFVEPQASEAKEKRTVEAAGGRATTEAVGAAAAVVLAIIGLAGALVDPLMSIATIVLGAVIVMDAAAVGARHNRIMTALSTGSA